MKAITPVVAVILLLLITISMVGFAFVWFTRIAQISTNQTQTQLVNQLTIQGQKIRIESVIATALTIRNIGTNSIPFDQILIFKDSTLVTCTTWNPATDPLVAAATTTCTAGFSCTPGQTIRTSAPGNEDSAKCP